MGAVEVASRVLFLLLLTFPLIESVNPKKHLVRNLQVRSHVLVLNRLGSFVQKKKRRTKERKGENRTEVGARNTRVCEVSLRPVNDIN